MDSRTNDEYTELPSVETPEDVAVLYSWANLHGAKYRDFSASRREYRAQLRHRAAEHARDLDVQAQADTERAAISPDEQAREAEQTRQAEQTHRASQASPSQTPRQPDNAPHHTEAALPGNLVPMNSADEAAAAERAIAERLEALRRAEAASLAEAAARRAERELAEAQMAGRRQAAIHADPEPRRRANEPELPPEELPGKISDPYTPAPYIPEPRAAIQEPEPLSGEAMELRPQRLRSQRGLQETPHPSPLPVAPAAFAAPQLTQQERVLPPSLPPGLEPEMPSKPAGLRRPQGYRPDDASGVRQIYRSPDPAQAPPTTPPDAPRRVLPTASPRQPVPPAAQPPLSVRPATVRSPAPAEQPAARSDWQDPPLPGRTWTAAASASPLSFSTSEGSAAGDADDPTPRRRRQDQPGYRVTDSDRAIAAYRREQGSTPDYPRPAASRSPQPPRPEPPPAPARAEAAVPEWLHGQHATNPPLPQLAPAVPQPEGSPAPAPAADTLQRSRERVASRWYALKGVFEQPGQDRNELAPVRQKETRPPVLAVFSFAGGVGKTSLVATLGRSLSSLGEKVLLTDTTSHGLLPFYFGASELREGTVRTFSPPSGSTDAPIYLVNYAVDQLLGQSAGDDQAQENVVEEITKGGRGSHRILLDLTSSTGWLIRRMAHLSPTILVPLAPDMNSVISLQSIEKFLHGITNAEGAPVQVFYLLNQFDASLPLHLDVREVLRRQLGERLLPFVIRRTPAVSEALAEGMTIVDYAADTPAAEDYMNVASWLRTIAAPATAGFRNVRWSER